MAKTRRILSIIVAIGALAGAAPAEDAQTQEEVQAAGKEKVLLRWQVPAGEAIALRTWMTTLDPSDDTIMAIDADQLAEGADLPREVREELNAFKVPESSSLTSILTALPSGNLSVKMVPGKLSPTDLPGGEEDEGIAEMAKEMKGTVQLRGEITDSGEIASFYLASQQKNLLALFFELPRDPVSVGDSWSLGVSLLAMGGGFICDRAARTNRVELVSLREDEGGELLACMDYCIAESVRGRTPDPFSSKTEEWSMAMAFVGRGEFLVRKGTWRRFAGRVHTSSTAEGFRDMQMHFAMEPLDEVPQELLNLE